MSRDCDRKLGIGDGKRIGKQSGIEKGMGKGNVDEKR